MRNQLYVKNAFSSGISKSFAETAQSLNRKEEHTIVGRSFTSTAKNLTRQKEKNVENIQEKPQSRMK